MAWEIAHAVCIAAVAVIIAAEFGWLHPVVTVHMRNDSGMRIDSAHFNFGNGEMEGELLAVGSSPTLAPSTMRDFGLYVPAEGTLTIQVRFADGTMLVSDAAYLERGDAVLVVVDTGRICPRRLDTMMKLAFWFAGPPTEPLSCTKI